MVIAKKVEYQLQFFNGRKQEFHVIETSLAFSKASVYVHSSHIDVNLGKQVKRFFRAASKATCVAAYEYIRFIRFLKGQVVDKSGISLM
ncbi:unnamed protein product [Dovyalis caffra]|uniref:Uncharacterized protein n=1 Tax=Dovyalis caffra TaxID=77055 RepID=A0AAV1SP77_9ROSI|nr:unnamed protein product [Dovyalis caffra]